MSSKLQAFLQPVKTEVTQEIIISDRFLSEDGNPAKITIKGITQEENTRLIKLSTKTDKSKGQITETFDKHEYQSRLIVACTVNPAFADKEICAAYGVVDPLSVPAKMFLAGEFAKLVDAILEINGFKDIDELTAEAKNF